MKLKGGTKAQVYIGNYADMRDLDVILENTRAQQQAAASAAEAYAQNLAANRRLLSQRAISREEYEQSLLDHDASVALDKFYQAQYESYQARFAQKEYSASVAAGKKTFDLETLYNLYVKEWEGQCIASKAAVAAAEAQYRLNSFVARMTAQLHRTQAVSAYEVRLRRKDLIAAQADLAAKRNVDSRCDKGQPTLKELQAMDAQGPEDAIL